MSGQNARRAPRHGRAIGAAAAALVVAVWLTVLVQPKSARAAWLWIEGEKPTRSNVHRNPYWYDLVKRDPLSGGDFLSHWDDNKPGDATYRVNIPEDGVYDFWVRANPINTRLSSAIDTRTWTPIDLEKARQTVNIAADGKVDLRFVAWIPLGKVTLKRGGHDVRFLFDGKISHHGLIDCFVLSNEPFTPDGAVRPDQAAQAARRTAAENPGWFAFAPEPDRFAAPNAIDLRSLNEKTAGEGGVIGVKGGRFVHSKTGRPIRFWAVNGPPGKDKDELRRDARILAKRGVNLVRVHHGYFDAQGEVKKDEVLHAIDVVEALKAEGIYTHFSIYFPLWLNPPPGTPWLQGYDGKTPAFAALYFNKDFQKRYRTWWEALLTTPSPATGKRLIDDPAVAGLEVINEDSFFFWTFNEKNIPDPQLRMLEGQFGDWLKARYGSIANALKRWNGLKVERDRPAEGRVGFRPLWNMAAEKTPRDQDTARFLAETQRGFYRETIEWLRTLGFKGVITASNWVTANPEVLGPLEKYTYTPGDFLDRHGYFGGKSDGPNAAWAIMEGLTFSDRSALRFDPEEPGKPRVFNHPAMDVHYDGKPSMLSETAWTRPNRYRSEAPLFYASYGALQGSDAIVYFVHDSSEWSAKPHFFMAPWTLMTPATTGQFPAAALIYRKGLVAEGDLLVDLNLRPDDLFHLKGTPLPQDASFDELRLKDVPKGLTLAPGNVIDPLVHFAGRTAVTFNDQARPPALKDLRPYIDRTRQTVKSTNGHLRLDYGKGVLTINAPAAQGVSGALREAGTADLLDLTVTSTMDLGHIVAVSLDDRPLATSRNILLQVMSEEKATGFQTEPLTGGRKKVAHIGRDPWLVRDFEGTVRLKRTDAATLKVTALNPNGEPLRTVVGAQEIRLGRTILYYKIEPNDAAAVP